jgi:hypothetical protein
MIEGLSALTPALCSEDVYMTLDLLSPNGIVWEEKWSERPDTMCMENCWSPAWINQYEDYMTFNVYVDELNFFEKLQVQRKSA